MNILDTTFPGSYEFNTDKSENALYLNMAYYMLQYNTKHEIALYANLQ